MGPEGLPKGSWRVLGAPGRPWSTDPKFLEHRPKLFGALGAVLAPLGALLAAFGAVLGPSWGLLGRSWDLPGRSWGSFWPPGGDFLALFLNALGKNENIDFPLFFQWFLKVCGGAGASKTASK